MSYFAFQALRSSTTSSDNSSGQCALMVPRLGSFADQYAFGSNSNGLFLPMNCNGAKFEVVDGFWNEPFLSRAATRLDLSALSSIESSLPSCPRTVSGQARENSVDELSLEEMDEELDSFENSPMAPCIDSGASTACVSPISVPSAIRVAKRKRRVESPARSVASSDVPRLHLGEYGRCKLKSLISAAIKDDCQLRAQVLSVSKIKLASIPQLLHMAQLCGLWDEAVLISEQFVKKNSH